MPTELERTHEVEPSPLSPLQQLANEYLITPSMPDDEVAQKLARGFSVSVDPDQEMRTMRLKFGGYKNGERRRDMSRDYLLGQHPELSFYVATLPVEAVIPNWGNRYKPSADLFEFDNMELSDSAIVTAMKSFAIQELEKGNASEEAVTGFIARLGQTEINSVPSKSSF